jgi:arylsulfatase A-like enzyme
MLLLVVLVNLAATALAVPSQQPPHIILVVADDYGWNDIGFHQTENVTCSDKKVVPTPTLDALAASGVKMENYYVQQVCSPTRGALMTGRYPSQTGIGPGIINPSKPYGMPGSEVFIPEILRNGAGYATHMVGKW